MLNHTMVHAYERESVQQIQLEKHTNPFSVKVYCPGWGKGGAHSERKESGEDAQRGGRGRAQGAQKAPR